MKDTDLQYLLNTSKRLGNHLIVMGRLLGSGHFGKVYLAYELIIHGNQYDLSKPLACKIISREQLSCNSQKQVQNEIQNLELITSSHFINLNKTYKTHSNYYIFTDLCNGGDLSLLKKAKGQLSEKESRLILSKLVEGVKDLFEFDLVHRDLKLANIMLHFPIKDSLKIGVNEYNEMDLISQDTKQKLDFLSKVDLLTTNFEVKIADFGFSKFLDNKNEKSATMCGTPLYMSPQIVDDIHYTYKTDIWSLGVIYYELLTGKYPFNGEKMEQLEKNLHNGHYVVEMHYQPSIECLQILTSCLNQDEDERISIEELSRFPYFDLNYIPHQLPYSLSSDKKSSLRLQRNSTRDTINPESFNLSSTSSFKMTLSSKDSSFSKKLSNTLSTTLEFSMFEQLKKSKIKTLPIETSTFMIPFQERAPTLSPLKKMIEQTCDFVMQGGLIEEGSQYIIAKDAEFASMAGNKIIVDDYFSFE